MDRFYVDYTFVAYGCARWFFGHLLAAPTEYDFVGGIFDAALVEYRPKSPQIACFRACGAPWDAIRVGVARRGTENFCQKW